MRFDGSKKAKVFLEIYTKVNSAYIYHIRVFYEYLFIIGSI